MGIKVILFDLDGTLVDAVELHYRALNEALAELNIPVITLKDHEDHFNGLPTKIKVRKLGYSDQIADQVNVLKQTKTITLINELIKVDQSKIDLMKLLKEKNIRIGCVTNCSRQTTELMLEKTGIKEFFELIITNEDVRAGKPNPEGYIRAMSFFEICPEETLVVEDSPKGIEAAKASHAYVWQVKNPSEVNCENSNMFLG